MNHATGVDSRSDDIPQPPAILSGNAPDHRALADAAIGELYQQDLRALEILLSNANSPLERLTALQWLENRGVIR